MVHHYNNKPEKYFSGNRGEMLEFIPENARRILEVGCGEGNFGLRVKQQRGAEVWGVEMFADAANIARLNLDHVVTGNIEVDDLDLPEEYFDCIVFNDVLEHLQYPWSVVEKIRKNLSPGGCLLASIPNIRYYPNMIRLLLHKEWAYSDAGILDRTHLRFFTKSSIQSMFESSGYTIKLLEGINFKAFPLYLKIINKLLGGSLSDMRYLRFACVAQK
jgi:2-polyprenyl-3-methyl-5-hydroxy-6-metoxy-1,4-benzoquinol methylase